MWLFKDGLVRLSSEPYNINSGNIQDMYMHLTNYSLNKKNEHFDPEKHKLLVSEVLSGEVVGDGCTKDSEIIWREIEDIVIKTIITAQP